MDRESGLWIPEKAKDSPGVGFPIEVFNALAAQRRAARQLATARAIVERPTRKKAAAKRRAARRRERDARRRQR